MGTRNRQHPDSRPTAGRPRRRRSRLALVAVTSAVATTALSLGPTSAPTPAAAVAAPASLRSVAGVQPSAKPFVWLRRGARGTRVIQVQRALKRRGYRVIANGKFGPMTHAAVRRFQRDTGLRVTGSVGPQTWNALGLNAPSPTTTTTTTTVPSTTAAPGAYRHPRASVERWRALAVEVGWDPAVWKRLSCIINRESRGYPTAQNPSGARGLLQILYSAHRARVGPDPSVLLDARTNLTIGLAIYRASGWRPWGSSTCAG